MNSSAISPSKKRISSKKGEAEAPIRAIKRVNDSDAWHLPDIAAGCGTVDVAFMDKKHSNSKWLGERCRTRHFEKAPLLADPKGTVERQLGQPLPDSLSVEVVQESTQKMFLVLPLAIAEAEEALALSDTALEQIAGGSGNVVDYRQDGPFEPGLHRRASAE